MNVYLHKSVNYSDMQWPCAEWFHVPSIDEFISLVSMLTTLWLATCTNLKTYLKIPTAWELYFGNPTVNTRQHIYLWSSSVSTTYRRVLTAFSTSDAISTNDNNAAWYAVPIRPFKDTVVVPDSTWTALYSDKIYHNVTLWLISISSDWVTWITIADKNLWATNVYNSWDTLSESNCWKYYQRWNNYWFPFDWSATTSWTAIDASNYWPWNYYSSSTFITVSNWDSSNNNNLRWWVSWLWWESELNNAYIGEYAPNFATQWPCPDGFHVPLQSDWTNVVNAWVSLGAWTTNNGVNFISLLKMPITWQISRTWILEYQSTYWYYWYSSPNTWSNNAFYLNFSTSWIRTTGSNYRSCWDSIRPFKDTAVIPDSNRTTLYSGTWDSGIFHDSTNWLISISSDWTTRYTIADKNLWATTVYNNWDTLSEANCWKYYQRWNNYWFPFTWPTSTSSTQVNTTGYWPWNYYTSSTYITGNFNWSSVQNDNLRWWVDWNVPVE